MRSQMLSLVGGGVSLRGAVHEDLGDPNQDSFFVGENHEGVSVYGVVDGHGPRGEEVAQMVKEQITHLVENEIKEGNKMSVVIERVVQNLEQEICKNPLMEDSGATLSLAVLTEQNLLTLACVGDCSAVIGTLNAGEIEAIELLSRHRPDNPLEKERIEKAGGKIDGEYVVHPLHEDKVIATTRTLGDKDMKKPSLFGIVSTPEIHQWNITKNDKFALLSSDGLLSVSHQTVVSAAWNLLNQHQPRTNTDVQEVSRILLEQLEQTTSDELEENRYQDDTTAVLIIFNHGE